jgi:branched-chain amino acid transport system substrate-binding protein
MRIIRTFAVAVFAIGLVAARPGHAEIVGNKIKIGVLNDQSSLFADITGRGSVTAAELAVEDFRSANPNNNLTIEIIAADHQNKADVGTLIARRWKDVDKVDAVVDVPQSAVALALNELFRDSSVAFLPSSAATPDLTGRVCSPNTIQWVIDTWALANSTGRALTRDGGDSWFFLTADFVFGHSLEGEAKRVIETNGGKVIGSARHPLNSPDFSSFLLTAQASNAKPMSVAIRSTVLSRRRNSGSDVTASRKLQRCSCSSMTYTR